MEVGPHEDARCGVKNRYARFYGSMHPRIGLTPWMRAYLEIVKNHEEQNQECRKGLNKQGAILYIRVYVCNPNLSNSQ